MGILSSLGRTAMGSSILRRSAMGGAAGGLLTGDWGGVAGGAAAAGAGWGAMRKYGPRLMGRGTRMMGRAATGLGNRLGRGAFDLTVGGAMRGWGGMGLTRAGAGMRNAANLLGNSRTMTNRIGGYAAGALGVGSAAYIGSSVLSSNRGY